MVEVVVRNGNLEKAMRVLKKKVQKEGIVKRPEIGNFIKNHLKLEEKPRNKVSKILRNVWLNLKS